eukprot:CAMPEP_0194404910 /NCGR_PEP_ID=MMETSP0176-20130528/3381_1 /TAXON_ID=216777 /ORGANISM="Proboscia alata, Strain PI-D3" /LENGTH=353 /DNA_ID=CAMNT_0039203461 /DNA_START=40 /DNA_END=1101 /DNA_ORIENTATION=+
MMREIDNSKTVNSTDGAKYGNAMQHRSRVDEEHGGATSDEIVLPMLTKPNGINGSKNAVDTSPSIWFVSLLTCSVGMVIINKSLSVGFPNPNTILGFQNSASVFYLLMGSHFGLFTVVPFNWNQFKPFIWVTVNWVIMLVLSLKMLQYNSVATMVTFRAFGTVMICMVEQVVFKTRYSQNAKLAMGMLFMGSFIYASADNGFSFMGYMWASLQISSWIIQTFIEKVATVESEQTKTGVAIIRNILSLPVITVMIIGSGETGAMAELIVRRDIWTNVALSSLLGCGLGLSTSALYKSFAPTTIAVANNVGKCVSIVVGCVLFKDHLGALQILGLALSFAGSFLYGEEERKRSRR